MYTDLEPDDVRAVAQLWRLKLEQKQLGFDPLVVFVADFKSTDGGRVLEKKLQIGALALGLTDIPTLTYEGDTGDAKIHDGSEHPRTKELADARSATISAIGQRLASFDGDLIELMIMAPRPRQPWRHCLLAQESEAVASVSEVEGVFVQRILQFARHARGRHRGLRRHHASQ